MEITYCTMKEVARQAQGMYINNDAIRAAVDAGENILHGTLAIGVALGKHTERQRRGNTQPPVLGEIHCRDSEVRPFHRSKAYRRVESAVRRAYGNATALETLNLETDKESFMRGFATAMRLLKECDLEVYQ